MTFPAGLRGLTGFVLAGAFTLHASEIATAQRARPDSLLTNADVVKLCSQFGDDVVIARIAQAKAADFDTGDDALRELKKAGVSQDVIAAMLQRTKNEDADNPPVDAMRIIRMFASGVRLRSKSGEVRLAPGPFADFGSGFASYFTDLVFFDIRGAAATSRVSDPRPSIVVSSADNPSAGMYLVKLDPSKKGDKRSLKLGKLGKKQKLAAALDQGYGPVLNANAPDPDWTVPFNASEEQPGLWVLVPKTNLKPGEYGLFTMFMLFDFGVDK